MTQEKAKKRTSKQLEFEVPGTPEQVWQAIATGPGISSWLFPTQVEEREGGAVAFQIGPGMESSGAVTRWDPPRTFAYEEPNWSEGAPPLGTEFVIEARSGNTCVIRLVHSLFTEKDQWDDEFGSFESGWNAFFKVLRLYLLHFPGQHAVGFRIFGATSMSEAEAWVTLKSGLGLTGAAPGQRWSTSGTDAPLLSGSIAHVDDDGKVREVIVVVDQPAPAIALLGVATWAQQVHVSASFYLFGEHAAAIASREEAAWTSWRAQHFPAA